LVVVGLRNAVCWSGSELSSGFGVFVSVWFLNNGVCVCGLCLWFVVIVFVLIVFWVGMVLVVLIVLVSVLVMLLAMFGYQFLSIGYLVDAVLGILSVFETEVVGIDDDFL